jgi:hypothetical protein
VPQDRQVSVHCEFARANAMTEGFVKLLADAKTDRLPGRISLGPTPA